jgi:phosphoesterase RecJ-like protein
MAHDRENIYEQDSKDKLLNQAPFAAFAQHLEAGFERFRSFVHEVKYIYLTTHEYPDADGLGSQIALYHALRKMDCQVAVANPDAMPTKYHFLDEEGTIQALPQDHQWPELEQTGILLLDTNNFPRTKHIYEQTRDKIKRLFIIDHHTCSDEVKQKNLIDTERSSTGELIFLLLHYLEVPLDDTMARALYTSILSDTGSFRYPNTKPITHWILAHLLRYNLDPHGMYANIFQNYRPGRVLLMGPVLERIRFSPDNQLAVIYIKKEEMAQFQVFAEDTDNIVNFPLEFQEVRGCLFFREEQDGLIKVSMRSQGNIDVAQIAHRFSGGGHKNAAGTKVQSQEEMDTLYQLFLQAIDNAQEAVDEA